MSTWTNGMSTHTNGMFIGLLSSSAQQQHVLCRRLQELGIAPGSRDCSRLQFVSHSHKYSGTCGRVLGVSGRLTNFSWKDFQCINGFWNNWYFRNTHVNNRMFGHYLHICGQRLERGLKPLKPFHELEESD